MHSTLTVRSNLVLIGLWAVAAAVLLGAARFQPGAVVLGAAGLGAATGALQGLAIRTASQALRAARSPMEVRNALTSTWAGRVAVGLQWVMLLVILLLVLGGNGVSPVGALGAFAGFLLLRDLLALPAVILLNGSGGARAAG